MGGEPLERARNLLEEDLFFLLVESLDGLNELVLDGDGVVGWGEVGQHAVLREEVEGAADAIVSRLRDEKLHAAVVVEGGADVPAVDSSNAPRRPAVGVDVDDRPAARGGKGVGVPVVFVPVEGVVGGLGGVDARGAQQVEGDGGLLGHLIPQLEGPVVVGAAQATDEVVFKCLDGALRGVDAVVRRLDELPPAVFFLQEVLDGLGRLVVGDVEGGPMALVFELIEDIFECFDDGIIPEVCNRDCKNVVSVVSYATKKYCISSRDRTGRDPMALVYIVRAACPLAR